MFRIVPEVFTAKDVAKVLRISSDAVTKSVRRTGAVRGVKVSRKQGMILFSRRQYDKIVADFV